MIWDLLTGSRAEPSQNLDCLVFCNAQMIMTSWKTRIGSYLHTEIQVFGGTWLFPQALMGVSPEDLNVELADNCCDVMGMLLWALVTYSDFMETYETFMRLAPIKVF